MSQDLIFLSARLPAFPGYDDEATRGSADERVRAFVGVRLAKLRERVGRTIGASDRDRIDGLILRCEFADQTYVVRLQHARLDVAGVATLAKNDRALIESVAAADDAAPADVPGLLTRVEGLLDARRGLAVG